MSVNKVIIVGRLGQDPELKYTPSGAAVCNFSLATSESWVDKSGQKQEKTEWHRIVVWGKQAEHCNQYLSKGRQVYLEGSLQTRSWDAQDGSKRYTTEVVARQVQFLGGANASGGRPNEGYNEQPGSQQNAGPMAGEMMKQQGNLTTDSNFTADDIPF